MSRLWLVRHGPTHATTLTGWTDLPADLSDLARIDALAAALPDAPVIASDLVRATATAAAVARGRPVLPPDPALREMHFGAWEGLTPAEAEARDPVLARRLWTTPGPDAPPGGESWDGFTARIAGALDRIAGEAVVVCHMGVILAALARAQGLAGAEAMAEIVPPLSLTVIAREDGWRVERGPHHPG